MKRRTWGSRPLHVRKRAAHQSKLESLEQKLQTASAAAAVAKDAVALATTVGFADAVVAYARERAAAAEEIRTAAVRSLAEHEGKAPVWGATLPGSTPSHAAADDIADAAVRVAVPGSPLAADANAPAVAHATLPGSAPSQAAADDIAGAAVRAPADAVPGSPLAADADAPAAAQQTQKKKKKKKATKDACLADELVPVPVEKDGDCAFTCMAIAKLALWRKRKASELQPPRGST